MAADSPSKDAFAQMLMDAIQKAGEKAAIQYDSEQFKLRQDGEKTSVMNLASVYNEYCAADPDKRQTIVKNLVRTWFSHRRETPEDFEDVKPDLLPTVRGRAYFEIAGIRAKIEVSAKAEDGAKFNWPFRPLAESLGIGLVYDLPESMLQLQQHNLDRWKATFDEVLDVACDNLRQITQHKMQSVARGVWRSPWHDNYDPSRMLLPEFIRHHNVTGDPVAMVPNRDTLLLTGSRDPVGLAKLAALAEEGYKHARSISGMAYRLNDEDEWVPFLPAENHPQCQQFKLLQTQNLLADYEEQKSALDDLHEKMGKDVVAAKFAARQNPQNGEVRSYCVWAATISMFLPRTDDVFFFRPKGEDDGEIVAMAPWQQVESVLGDLLKPVGIYPERYLVDEFPSEEQFAALKGN